VDPLGFFELGAAALVPGRDIDGGESKVEGVAEESLLVFARARRDPARVRRDLATEAGRPNKFERGSTIFAFDSLVSTVRL